MQVLYLQHLIYTCTFTTFLTNTYDGLVRLNSNFQGPCTLTIERIQLKYSDIFLMIFRCVSSLSWQYELLRLLLHNSQYNSGFIFRKSEIKSKAKQKDESANLYLFSLKCRLTIWLRILVSIVNQYVFNKSLT